MTIPEAAPKAVFEAVQRGEAVLIDVREPWEHDRLRIDGALLIPLTELSERVTEVPSDRDVYITCRMGGRSARAVEFLLEGGRTRVHNVVGGMEAWIEAGLPVIDG